MKKHSPKVLFIMTMYSIIDVCLVNQVSSLVRKNTQKYFLQSATVTNVGGVDTITGTTINCFLLHTLSEHADNM